jgi:hypothetical protein
VIRGIKRRISCKEQLIRTADVYRVLVRKYKTIGHLKDLIIDCKIPLELILQEQNKGYNILESSGLGKPTVAASFKYGSNVG